MRLELDTRAIDLAPGTQVAVGARVVNDGPDPIDVVLGIAGLDNDGIRPVAELGVIPPGSSAVTTLHFALPKGAVAGLREVAIHADDRRADDRRAHPATRGGERVPDRSRQTERLSIRVLSTERLSLALQRSEVRGRFRGRLRADLRNQGNEPLTVRLWGEGDDVAVRFARDTITLPPGHATRVKGRVRLPGVSLRGEQRRAFVVTAQGASTPTTTSGSYVQRGVLPASLFTLIAILVVLALWVTGLIYVQGRLRDDGNEPTAGVTTTTPGGGTTPVTVPGGSVPGTTPDAGPGGTDGGPDGSVPPGEAVPGVTVVPVSIIGAVDGPVDKAGTSVALDLISSGPSQAGSGESTKVAAFASVREVTSTVLPPQRTTTDENGKFRFNNITQVPALYRITLYREGFDVASEVVNIDGKEPNVNLAIKLTPAAGILGGTVLDASGAALGGVAVTVSSGDLGYATTTADGTGGWRIEGVSTPATYIVQFAKPGYAAASLIQALDGGDTATGLTVRMQQGAGTVRGRVVVALAGIGGLKVTLGDGVRTIVTTTRTDDPVGFFEFPGVPLGTYSLTIEGEGWQTSAREVTLDSGLKDLGTITDLLRSTATIRGTVTQEAINTISTQCVLPLVRGQRGATQQPCGGVGITASQGSTSFRTTSSSGDGSFLLAGIPPGTYTLTFERFGYSSVVFGVSVGLGDNLTVDPVQMFVLPRDVEASGVLQLRLSSLDPALALSGTAEMLPDPRQVALGLTNPPVPFSGAAGANVDLTIPDLVGGARKVRIIADGHEMSVIDVQIAANSPTQANAVLTPLGTVLGRVTDTIVGKPVAPVPNSVVFLAPVGDPDGLLLVPPPGTPANPSSAYLRADPAVGEVRFCEKNSAAVGDSPTFELGLCTRADANGDYRFANAVRAGTYRVSTPRNEADGVDSAFALDHLLATSDVVTALNTVSTVDLPLHRYGAVVASMRSVDLATGVVISPLDAVTVTAYFCQPDASTLGCAFPASGGPFIVARGRVSDDGNGTLRIDRLAPAGLDPVTQFTVGDYLLRFQRDGFVDEFRKVAAPALDTDVPLNVVMLPKPTKVAITPYWTKAGTTAQLTIPGASVHFSGIVDYTDADPPQPIIGSVTDTTPDGNGSFDSGSTVFRVGEVEVTVTAPGFTDLVTTVALDPGSASGSAVEDLSIVLDPADNNRMLASAQVKVAASARSVSGTLTVVCCTAASSFVPTNVADVHAALTARLTLDADAGVVLTAPVGTNGAFTIPGVEPGDYTLTFTVGTNSIDLDGHISLPSTPVDVGFTANTSVGTLQAVLEAATLSGTITDIDDSVPLEGATVTVEGTTNSTVTDEFGFYSLVIDDVPGTVSLRITKADDRDDCLGTTPLLTPGGAVTFDLDCAGPRGVISGTVLGRDQPTGTATPLAGASVVLKRLGSPDVFRSTVTTDGTFEFLDVPAGTTGSRDYVLEVSKTAYEVIAPIPVTVRPRQTSTPSVTLTASTRAVSVLVRSATTSGGNPVPLGGVTVTATRSGSTAVFGTTAPDGTVTLNLAPGDPWALTTTGAATAVGLGFRAPHLDGSGSVTVGVGTGTVTATPIVLRGPFATVTGTVTGQLNPATAPQPLQDATVTIATSFGSVQAVTQGAPDLGVYLFSATVPVGFAGTTAATVTAAATGYTTSTPRNESIPLALAPLGDPTTSLAVIALTATPQSALVTVRGRESNATLQNVLVTATLVGSPATIVQGSTSAAGTRTLLLAPGTWTLTTSNGATALAGGVLAPHGDVIGSVVVAFNTAPAPTTLLPAALVAVGGSVRSVPTGDVGTFPSRPLSGASITITRVGVADPAEPVNTFSANSVAGAYQVLGGLTPGVWEIGATAAGHDPAATITITVVAATPVTNANLQLDEQPIHLTGTVRAGATGVDNVSIVFRSGGQTSSPVFTAADGTYSIELAASQEWEVAFDPSTSSVANQNIPVLYRYIGTAQGGTAVVLDHTLFTDVVSLTVKVKGVLATQCDQTSCVEHDLGVAATVTLTDNGNATGNPNGSGQNAVVQFTPQGTTAVGGVQTASFAEVPNLTNYALSVTAPGYANNAITPLDLTSASYPCAPPATTTRCVTVRLNAQPRAVSVTVTDLAGAVVPSTQVVIRSKAPATGVNLSCNTDAGGVCTINGVQPAFSPYAIYELVVNPAAASTRGQYVQDLVVPAGTGTLPVTVTAVPVKPVVTIQPTAVAVWADGTASFTAAASGRPAPGVVWEEAPPGGSFTAVTDGINTTVDTDAGTTTSTLSVNPVGAGGLVKNGYRYRATFTNQDGPASTASSITTNEAVLTTAQVTATLPIDMAMFAGDDATFVATSVGATTTVQWQRDSGSGFANLGGATTSSSSGTTTSRVTESNVKAGDTGNRYKAVFTLAGAGTRESRIATLTIGSVSASPSNTTVFTGTNATFSVSYTAGMNVQWQFNTPSGGNNNWANVTASLPATSSVATSTVGTTTTSTLTVLATGLSGYRFRAAVSSTTPTPPGTANPAQNTSQAVLTVVAAPAAPANATVWAGNAGTFGVTLPSGATVVWQYATASAPSTFADVTVAAIPGAAGITGSTLTVPTTDTSLTGYRFRARVTLSGATVDTGSATLTVVAVPAAPANAAAWAGDTVSFTVAPPSGATVVWQYATAAQPNTFNNVTVGAIPGATGLTSNTLSVPVGATAGLNGYRFRARLTLATVDQDTGAATLSVAIISTQPSATAVTAGATANFSVASTGAATSVQWQVALAATPTVFTNLAGQTATSLALPATTVGMSGNRYRAVLTITGFASVTKTSSEAILTVNP